MKVLNESRWEKNVRLQRQIADMQPSGAASDAGADNDDDDELLVPSESPQQPLSIN